MNVRAIIAACAFACAGAFSGAASAQENSEALAREVVTLMEVEETVNTMFDAMAPLMGASIGQELRFSSSEQARFGEILAEEFRGATPELAGSIADVYVRHMSEAQLRDVVTFLRSPSGQAWVETQSSAEGELERIGQEVGMRVALQAMVRFNAERAR